MEDTFRVRVDKIFGSLTSSSSSSATPSSSLSSLWSLTDDEIQRREWIREKGSPDPEPNSYQSFLAYRRAKPVKNSKDEDDYRFELEKDIEDLDDNDVEDDEDRVGSRLSSRTAKPDDYGDEEWEIKSSIGLDSTLDYEEEEDQYDKLADGKEEARDNMYMKEINDYGIDVDSISMLPTSFKEVVKDPRANHLAAKIRLKEDADAAKGIDSLRVSDNDAPTSIDAETISSENGINPKSILKRKETQLDLKSHKRVRFDPECKDNSGSEADLEGTKAIPMESSSTGVAKDHLSGVPDYLRNPSKYTRYNFDSSNDMDEESNKQAYMDFLKQLKKSNNMEPPAEDASADLSKAVKFIPRKKTSDATMSAEVMPQVGNRGDFVRPRAVPISIAVAEGDVCAMEEDEPEMAAERRDSLQRTGRQYRMKARSELDE
ncbi:hypothetical protein FNV43_RR22406 [Rhamnella rubrinervis]|uniref:U5 small nuclear ribonucleoprotein TSSC4 n=1 Tax=Rhamnella rubrinervis TaxID=2594499 RepID=A0A8K0DWI7_9ROSA|nr:hypothetical protein FNV43_RR22406 [Rhamnella rubrinervis]